MVSISVIFVPNGDDEDMQERQDVRFKKMVPHSKKKLLKNLGNIFHHNTTSIEYSILEVTSTKTSPHSYRYAIFS